MKKHIYATFLIFGIFLSNHLTAQNVGIGEPNPGSKLSVKGGMSVGTDYSNLAGPTGGLIIEGVMGIGTTSPDSNAILDIASSSKGIKFPTLTQAQRTSIRNPSKGLMLFDTDSNNVYYNDGTNWQSMVNVTQVTSMLSGIVSTVSSLTNNVNGLLGSSSTGGAWYTGSAAPTLISPVANTGDMYLASSTGNYYKKTSTLAWTLEGNLFGPTGPAGATGAAGTAGAAGAKGATGTNGTNGTNGATGATGTAGAQGVAGATGAAGAQGIQGATGTAGAAGSNGTNGSNGAVGATGAAGSNGTQGSQGIQGVTGSAGAAGAQGIQGVAGATGAAGAAGAKGATGSTGTTGTNGATGATGANGATGSQGIQGATGSAGTNGTNGTNGAAGAQGTQGVAGATGLQGPTGTSGWSLTGNSISAGTNFIGTTNNASFRVRTNNTERMVVDSLGNVGMGTTTPVTGLNCIFNYSNKNVITIENSSTSGFSSMDFWNSSAALSATFGFANSATGSFFANSAYMNSYGNNFILSAESSTQFDFFIKGSNGNIGMGTGTPLSSLDVAGNLALGTYAGSVAAPSNGLIVSGSVGIGNSSPSYQLDVTGTGRYTGALTIGSYTMPTANGSAGQVLTANSNGTASWASAGSSSGWSLTGNSISAGTNFMGTTNNASLRLRTDNVERVTIDSTGNLGIGTTSPKNKLDVNGGIAVGSYAGAAALANGILVSGDVGVGTNGDYATLTVQASGGKPVLLGGGSSTGSELKLDAFGGQHFSIYNNGLTNANGNNYLTFANTSVLATDNTAGTSLMTLEDDGSLGIGVTAPQSALDVNGGISVGAYAGNESSPTNGLIVSGSVGFGTASPSSSFEIDGGFSTKITTITSSSSTTLDNTSWIWYFTGTSSVVLPSASSCTYRRYWIVNKTSSTKTVSTYVPLTSSSSATTMTSYTSIELVSNGTSWLQIK